MARANFPVVVARFPEPNSNPPDRQWADSFIRALTAEFSKIIQPIGTQYLVTGFTVPSRTLTGPAARTAHCQVGTVMVRTNTDHNVTIDLGEPRTTPANTGDVLATLIRDLQTRGWLA